ncbi:MAG: exopolysaccharide biosynthesis polyprenyl glycosylphosphotransferase [Lachnospiraceae bacterium]|nr:exopolysaccharide biosynthesis polyprenyl glycosylphosphotransferase [Lachnospiraceae bacterium]
MKKKEQYKRLIMFVASVLIVAIQTGVFAYAWFHDYHTPAVIGRRYSFWGHWALIALYAFLVVVVSKLFSAFKVGYQRILDVLLSQIFSVLIVNFVVYLQLALIGRWKFLEHIGPMLRVCVINLAAVIIWVLFMRWIYVRIYPPHAILLIYGKLNPKPLMEKMKSRRDKYIIQGAISLERGIDVIKDEILKHQAVMICDIPSHERNLFLKFCFEHDIRCYCEPKISDIMIMSSEEINMFDTPLLLFRNRGLTVEQEAVKRIFDVIISTVGLVILSPLFLLIAILIKGYDGGPVFYRQERLTKDGKIFMVFKFRSMRVDSEKSGARLAAKGDSRVTPIGNVLRNIHFDELPQLLNIIAGDMSLVGPRPERPEIAAEYEKEIPEFSYRLKVKAGLTGYAQVYGKYNTKPYDKLKLDLTYIENFSFLLDLQLIATTVKILFQKENTEGVEQWQKTASVGGPQYVGNEVPGDIDPGMRKTAADTNDRGVGVESAAGNARPTVDEQPLVSVIIPAYRCAHTIRRAIDSALAQEVPVEILVLDDCSPDNLHSVMRKYRRTGQVHYYKNEKSLGAAGTRNRGVQMAKGKYIAFLDADDWWEERKLKKQLALLEADTSVVGATGYESAAPVLCATGRELITPEGKPTGHVIPVCERITYRRLLLHNCINCSSVVVRADVAREFPMEYEDSHEDYITWLRILKKYGCAVAVNEPLLKYRLSASGKSGNKLQSARMTYHVYRYVGYGRITSVFLFCAYAFNGVRKYTGAYLRR